MADLSKPTIVTGVIGADCHIVGHRLLSFALERAGFHVVSLGALTPAEDFIKAAVETDADAIFVSSMYGHGQLDCQGFPQQCLEAGLEHVRLYVGGYLSVGQQRETDAERLFTEMGFHRVFSAHATARQIAETLRHDLASSGHARARP